MKNIYHVYVLRSKKHGKLYTGYTHKQPEERLAEHNSGCSQWTKSNGPFVLVYSEVFKSKSKAIIRERYLKSGGGRKFLNTIIPR